MSLDRETEKRIEQPVSLEAERETRLSPAEAIAQMRIRVPVRANRKLRTVIERVNQDAPRVSVVIKLDIRPGHTGAMTEKLASIERHLRET